MAIEPRRMNFDEFALHLRRVFDTLRREGRPILVERDGELYRVEPQAQEPHDVWASYDVQRVRQALRRSAGALRGVDRQELLADIQAQRGQDSQGRPA